jgi:hypothetical protein
MGRITPWGAVLLLALILPVMGCWQQVGPPLPDLSRGEAPGQSPDDTGLPLAVLGAVALVGGGLLLLVLWQRGRGGGRAGPRVRPLDREDLALLRSARNSLRLLLKRHFRRWPASAAHDG